MYHFFRDLTGGFRRNLTKGAKMQGGGTVYQRPGRKGYYARIIIDGKPFNKGSFSTKAMARTWLAKMETKVEKAEVLGTPLVHKEMRFKEILTKWEAWLNARRLKPKTIEGYHWIAHRVLLPHFGNMLISRIDSRDVENFRGKRAKLGLKPGTLNRDLSTLSSVFEYAIHEGCTGKNPARGIKRAKEDVPSLPHVSMEDANRLIAAMPPWLQTPALVALDAGLRAGEIGALVRRDIDLGKRRITVRESKNHTPRTLRISDRLVSALAAHLKGMPKGQETLFLCPNGKAFSSSGYRYAFRSATKRAGLNHLRFHDLRHACATHMAELGGSLAEIKAYLGHKTPYMTLRYMDHAPEDFADRIVGRQNEAHRADQPDTPRERGKRKRG